MEILISSSWISLVMLAPMIVLFGNKHGASASYYLLTGCSLLPFFIIPSSIGVVSASLFVTFFPPRYGRFIASILAIALGGALIKFVTEAISSNDSLDINDILTIVSFLLAGNQEQFPSYWVASTIASSLQNDLATATNYIGLGLSTAFVFIGIAYTTVLLFHRQIYSISKSRKGEKAGKSTKEGLLLKSLSYLIPTTYRPLFMKDFRLISRDSTQLTQLVLIFILCSFYLYFMSIQKFINLSDWWAGFFITNTTLVEGFMVTAIGTRFVFPSISLEGRGFWTIQTSPLNLLQFIKAKFSIWFITIWLSSSAMFCLVTYVITGDFNTTLLKFLVSTITSYTSLGLAVGLGGYFANFRWEHPSQLSASLGSILYMIASVCTIGINLYGLMSALSLISSDKAYSIFYAIAITSAIVFLNYWLVQASLKSGLKKLANYK